MPLHRQPRFGLYLTGLAYCYGLLLGALSLAWQVLFHHTLPSMLWWQWALAPLGLGVAALTAEWAFEKLQESTGFGEYGKSKAKRLLHLAILLAVLAALVIGPAMYKIANP